MNAPSKGQVLIVDDNHEVLIGAELRLCAEGYAARVAYDASEALRSISDQPPDAIVLDMVMPGMSGLELIACLRRLPATRRIPVIMLSASLRDKQSALDAGARYFLPKPYDAEHLLAALDAAIHEPLSLPPTGRIEAAPSSMKGIARRTGPKALCESPIKPRKSTETCESELRMPMTIQTF
jgi:CheY-like chemotaxis protein